MTNTAIRIGVILIGIPYWYGVLSGYYANHGPYTNDNPNTFIMPGVMWLSIFVAADFVRDIWKYFS